MSSLPFLGLVWVRCEERLLEGRAETWRAVPSEKQRPQARSLSPSLPRDQGSSGPSERLEQAMLAIAWGSLVKGYGLSGRRSVPRLRKLSVQTPMRTLSDPPGQEPVRAGKASPARTRRPGEGLGRGGGAGVDWALTGVSSLLSCSLPPHSLL